jgi:hypothetical protein
MLASAPQLNIAILQLRMQYILIAAALPPPPIAIARARGS